MKLVILPLLFITLFSSTRADSWLPPTARVFSSPNGKFLLHILPKALKSFPELPEDAAGNSKERKTLGLNETCQATLFQKDNEKGIDSATIRFHPVWQQKLVNEVAPMDAYVSDDGRFVVTTDDYGFLGDGENVVVIYSEGKFIRRYKLTEFIPQSAIDTLQVPQSTSSIEWAGRHRIDSKNGLLLLQVWKSGNPFNLPVKTPAQYRTVTIRLSTGEILQDPKPKVNR